MSTIQQLKNFIRHGKQARAPNEEPARKAESSPKQSNTNDKRKSASDPTNVQSAAPDLHSEPAEKVARKEDSASIRASRRVDDANLAKLVAEENASKTKFPQYPGLERWVLLEKMGDGAFSNVYRARDTEGQYGEVAIKVVRKYEMNNMQRANILKEVQIMRQLDHPNVIKLIDFSESKPYYYIVLELAPGGELFHQIVRLTYFSEELSRHVIVKVAKALEYLHEEKGVVHRDIKPENILFNPIDFVTAKVQKPKQPGDEEKADEGEFIVGVGAGGIGEIKIADFGLSKIVWDKQTMTPCGTVGYTAPEIVKDERYSKSVDMWALVAKGQYTFLSPWWDDISKSAKDLISHLLTVDPEKRYTITEFLAHPWVRASGPTPREERKPEAPLRAFDPSKLDDRRVDFRSPGAVNLREVFDVGYAVHRQEEEAKRRAQIGTRAGPGRPLGGLNEADEEEETEVDNQPQGGARVLEQGMRKASIQDQDTNTRGRERERATNDKGYGQHSSAVTAAARQQVRDRNRNKGPFELNLDNATLLGKRGKKMPIVGA
ncbi:calcium/calmodulin-dependent protein kinase, putative [Cordyceps militaris CM01]|uniref:Calcium/calmodulin-dependent protein kinase, putative n=1 Tax=Cordyceps militaris (strain CM01) TaxID=983644 RepID=G3J7L4_CORMM|nr:calcium/calmodulin-dependent protein kinase, putative [Cordyceps militaris CM01]EGX95480.1 calcium/calmodulin-dependent protein kinase, putative [Cordyceps militaris CM01]